MSRADAKRAIQEPSRSTVKDRQDESGFMPSAGPEFVATDYVQGITDRALSYLRLGYALHLSGPAGTGKTTLALHIASQLGQPCTMLHGDDAFVSSDLVGKESGFKRTSIRDNYISSIVKTEESISTTWRGNRLTRACREGHTLIYDEFTRSPASANNPFLSVLEEGILSLPPESGEGDYLQVHPSFRAIFTSNPEEYVAVHKTQDALLDRMITLELSHPDCDTEVAIVQAKSGCSAEHAQSIVDVLRRLRMQCDQPLVPTVRAGIAMARIVQLRKCSVSADDPVFRDTCIDVLGFTLNRQTGGKLNHEVLINVVKETTKVQDFPIEAAKESIAPPNANKPQEAPAADDLNEVLPKPLENADELASSEMQICAIQDSSDATTITDPIERLEQLLDVSQKSIDTNTRPTGSSLPRPPAIPRLESNKVKMS